MHPLHQQHVGSAHSANPGSDYYRPPHPDNPCYPPFSTAPGQSNRSDAHPPPSHGHASAGSSTQYPLHPSFHGHDVGSHHLSSSHNHQAAAGGLAVDAQFRLFEFRAIAMIFDNSSFLWHETGLTQTRRPDSNQRLLMFHPMFSLDSSCSCRLRCSYAPWCLWVSSFWNLKLCPRLFYQPPSSPIGSSLLGNWVAYPSS